MPRILKPCGTHAAYCRHINRGEQPCEPCKRAHAEHQHAYAAEHREARRAASRAYYLRHKDGGSAHLDPCGTPSAYQRHVRHQEEACTPCKTAWADYCREAYRRRKREAVTS